MLPRLDSVRPPGAVDPAARLEAVGDPRQEAFQRSLGAMLGKTMQGEVLARLTDGNFLVKVAGTPARMPLPAGAQVGAEVALKLIALDPRPAFEVGAGVAGKSMLVYPDATQQGAPLRAAAQGAVVAGQVSLPAAAQPAAGPATSSTTQLSETARVLATVLGTALNTPNAQSAIVGRVPLAPAPGVIPAQMAAALKDAIGTSGLFYESHVAEWADGKRDLADLLREPQMRTAPGSAEPAARQGASMADPATAQLINLQLATHEQARVSWQGQAWPGQYLHWEVSKDAPEQDPGPDGGGEPAWRSGVRLRFPLLGEVAGTIVIAGGRLHIQLQAGSEESGALLRRHAAALTTALDAAGTPLSSLDIQGARPPRDG